LKLTLHRLAAALSGASAAFLDGHQLRPAVDGDQSE
jgi:hypothetical protein